MICCDILHTIYVCGDSGQILILLVLSDQNFLINLMFSISYTCAQIRVNSKANGNHHSILTA